MDTCAVNTSEQNLTLANQTTPKQVPSPLKIQPEQQTGIIAPQNTPTSACDSSISDMSYETNSSFNSITDSNETLTSDQETFETGNDDEHVQIGQLKRKTVALKDKIIPLPSPDTVLSKEVTSISQELFSPPNHEITSQTDIVSSQYEEILQFEKFIKEDEPTKPLEKNFETVEMTPSSHKKSETIETTPPLNTSETTPLVDPPPSSETSRTPQQCNHKQYDTNDCQRGKQLKSRFSEIVKQNRLMHQKTTNQLADEKVRGKKLENEIDKLKTTISEHKQKQVTQDRNDKTHNMKITLQAQDKTISDLKQMNEKMINTVRQLISHNENIIDQVTTQANEKVNVMQTHFSKNSEQNQILEKVKQKIEQLEVQNRQTQNMPTINTNIEPLIIEVKEKQEKISTSQEQWNANMSSSVFQLTKTVNNVQNALKNASDNQGTNRPMNANENPQEMHYLPQPSHLIPPPLIHTAPKSSYLNPTYMQHQKQVVLIIADSNGNHLRKDELCRGKTVMMETRSTAKDALNNVPKIPNPSLVSDVVLLVGLNDSKSPDETIGKIVQTELDIVKKFSQIFPTARFHLGCVPPSSPKQVELNIELEDMSKKQGIMFITSKPLYDRHTRLLRSGMLERDTYHYTDHGIRIMAKEIKRSLHRKPLSALASQNRSNQRRLVTPPSNLVTHDTHHIPLSAPVTFPSNQYHTSTSNLHQALIPKSNENRLLDELLQGMSKLISNVKSNLA